MAYAKITSAPKKLPMSQSRISTPAMELPSSRPNACAVASDMTFEQIPTASVIRTKYVPQNHCKNVRMHSLLFGAKSSMSCQGVTYGD
jgi:hypothetical protein